MGGNRDLKRKVKRNKRNIEYRRVRNLRGCGRCDILEFWHDASIKEAEREKRVYIYIYMYIIEGKGVRRFDCSRFDVARYDVGQTNVSIFGFVGLDFRMITTSTSTQLTFQDIKDVAVGISLIINSMPDSFKGRRYCCLFNSHTKQLYQLDINVILPLPFRACNASIPRKLLILITAQRMCSQDFGVT